MLHILKSDMIQPSAVESNSYIHNVIPYKPFWYYPLVSLSAKWNYKNKQGPSVKRGKFHSNMAARR
jgi:hypothetical protein